MLFNSYIFLFAFLPLTLFCFYVLNRRSRTATSATFDEDQFLAEEVDFLEAGCERKRK